MSRRDDLLALTGRLSSAYITAHGLPSETEDAPVSFPDAMTALADSILQAVEREAASPARTTQRWQHDETGRICELPYGESPGRRWQRIPDSATMSDFEDC